MASVRSLKKDIQYLSAQLIGDCLDTLDNLKEGQKEKILAIIEESVALNNSSIERASHPDVKDNPKLVKEFYKKLKKDFIQNLDQAYKKLEELIKN